MKKRSHRILEVIINQVIKHPVWFVCAAFLLTIVAVATIVLRFDIRSDIKDLMPPESKSVVDMYKIADRMGSIQTLDIYLKVKDLKPLSPELKASDKYKACLDDIGSEENLLRDDPIVGETWCDNALMLYSRDFVSMLRELESVGNVGFHQDKTFFDHNILLYASNEELEQGYNEIDEALTEARRQSGEYKACLLVESDESACDELKPSMAKTPAATEAETDSKDEGAIDNFKQKLLDRYSETELAGVKEFPFYQIADGWMVALEVRFRDSTTSLKSVQKEIKHMEELAAKLNLADYDNLDVVVDYGGGLNEMKSEYNAIVVDIVRSISVTVLSIIGLIAIFFASIRAAFRIFVPLIMSTLWSLGITFATVGFLNLITAFIFAILIGLGIDFGIHLYARFNLERRHGLSTEEAIRKSVVETGSPVFFGALTTAAAFFTLMFGSFPGFSQFGFVAGIGVLLAFCTMATVMPAFVLVSEKLKPSKVKPKTQKLITRLMEHRAAPILIAVSVIAITCVGFGLTRVSQIQFEENYYNLQFRPAPPKPGEVVASPQVALKKYVTKSTRPSSPTIAIMDDYDQVSMLDLYIKRDREYLHFEDYRKIFTKLPETTIAIVDLFKETLPYLGQHRSLPMIAAIDRIMPDFGDTRDVLPLFAHYGSEKSQNLQLYRKLALVMPNSLASIYQLAPEVLDAGTSSNAIGCIATIQRHLPQWMWTALPTQRPSNQLNSISDFASIFSYLPGTDSQQAERLATIQRIAERTSDRNIRFLPDDEKEKIRSFRRYLVTEPVSVDQLPEWTKFKFKESGKHPLPPRPESGVDYAFGNIAVLYQATSTYNGYQAHILTDETRSIRIDDKPITAATGAFVYADMLTLVQTDGIEISAAALIVILLIAIIQQKNPISALLVTLPVLSGMVMTLFTMVMFGLKLGLFNIVMLPVILGIGIDGSIYLLQRYQMLGRGSVLQATKAVLPPVFMSSFTTLIGFGGMITSRHMGLNTMGQLAIIGISICFFSTFLIQPGLIYIVDKLGLKWTVPSFDYDPDKPASDE